MQEENEEKMIRSLGTIASRMENIELAILAPLEKIESTLSMIASELQNIGIKIEDQ